MYEKELRQITQEVWRSVAQINVLDCPNGTPDDVLTHQHLAGVIHITGEWTGLVIVRCSGDLIKKALVAILGETVGNYDDVTVADVLSELTNIIGGNIKAALPSPCKLSLPVVIGRDADSIDLDAGHRICQVVVHGEGYPILVEMIQLDAMP